MFDVFDIQFPALAAGTPIEVRQREFAFGVPEQRTAYVAGVELGRILRADEAYTDLQAGTGSTGRGAWTVVVADSAARAASTDDELWSSFLGAIVSLLKAQKSWRVRCESDRDQHPLERHEISAEGLSAILDARRAERAPIAIVVEGWS